MKRSEPQISVAETYSVSKERLWSALTIVEEKQSWFFENIPAFEPIVGFKTSFMVANEKREFLHQWEVMEVLPAERLRVRWSYDGYDGLCDIVFELEAVDSHSQLTVRCEVLEDFSADIPEFRRESAMAGWTYFLKQRLKSHLEKGNNIL